MEKHRMKEGDVMKYNAGSTDKWEKCHAVLFSDSEFCWYKKLGVINPLRWCNGSYKLRGSVLLLDVRPYICIGLMTERMPVKPPDLPNGYAVHHLVGIGMDPDAKTVHWILFSSDAEIESWTTEIFKTLPIVNPPPQQPQSAQKSDTTSINDDEPPKVEGNAPPPYYNQRQGSNDEGRQPPPTSGATKTNINEGGDVRVGGRGRSISASALGRGLLGFGSAVLAGGSMWRGDEADVREGGYHSDSDTNDTDGDADYLDLSEPTQSNDDDHCHTGGAGSTGLGCQVAGSDGFDGGSSGDFGSRNCSSGDFGVDRGGD